MVGDDNANPPRQQQRGTSSGAQSQGSDSDRKPAALPTGIYRQPISREYFARKSTSLSPRTSQGGEGAEIAVTEDEQKNQETVQTAAVSEAATQENMRGMSLYEELRRQCLAESNAARIHFMVVAVVVSFCF